MVKWFNETAVPWLLLIIITLKHFTGILELYTNICIASDGQCAV